MALILGSPHRARLDSKGTPLALRGDPPARDYLSEEEGPRARGKTFHLVRAVRSFAPLEEGEEIRARAAVDKVRDRVATMINLGTIGKAGLGDGDKARSPLEYIFSKAI